MNEYTITYQTRFYEFDRTCTYKAKSLHDAFKIFKRNHKDHVWEVFDVYENDISVSDLLLGHKFFARKP